MRPLTHDIVMTKFDHNRLRGLLRVLRDRSDVNPWNLDALELELSRAEVVSPDSVPSDVVTMNSRAVLRDLDTGDLLSVALVFPNAYGCEGNAVPVLSPMGLALLGCRVGHVLAWDTAEGTRRLLVDRVEYQPEAAGNFFL
ncbi:MAG TPA: GreA/GreB family elongation factor [Polyangiaceae bacterium]|nr:GreA/GreB family elongation factor [Polyangiaceae bacterium]